MGQVYKDQKIWFDGYDLTAAMNSIALDYGVETQDNTTFGDASRSNKGGLATITAQIEGFYDAVPDKALFEEVGIADRPISFGTGNSPGAVVYSFKSLLGDYTPLKNSVGDLIGFSAGGQASKSPLLRGILAANAVGASGGGGGLPSLPLLYNFFPGSSGNTPNAPVQYMAVPSGKKLYAILHVTRLSGSISVGIKSDDTQAFSSPVTRVSFAAQSDVGSQWLEIPGPITDSWWLAEAVVGGDADYAVILAVQ